MFLLKLISRTDPEGTFLRFHHLFTPNDNTRMIADMLKAPITAKKYRKNSVIMDFAEEGFHFFVLKNINEKGIKLRAGNPQTTPLGISIAENMQPLAQHPWCCLSTHSCQKVFCCFELKNDLSEKIFVVLDLKQFPKKVFLLF